MVLEIQQYLDLGSIYSLAGTLVSVVNLNRLLVAALLGNQILVYIMVLPLICAVSLLLHGLCQTRKIVLSQLVRDYWLTL